MRIYIYAILVAICLIDARFVSAKEKLVLVEDYRNDIAAERLISRLSEYKDKSIILEPLKLNYRFITSDSFHAYFRNLLSMKQNTPDIFFMDQIYLADFVKSGFIADLTRYYPAEFRNKYLEYALRPAMIDDKLWALPIHSEVGVIFYRKDILNELGLSVPKTWNDLRNASLAVMEKHSNIFGYVGQFKEYEGLVCNFLEFAWSNGADPFEAREEDRKKMAEALQTLVTWVNVDKIIPMESLEMTEGESLTLFTKKQALFLRHWPSGGISWFKEAMTNNEVGLMALPRGPSGEKSYMVTGGWYYVVNAYSKYINKAIKLLSFVDNEKSQLINFETKREIPSLKKLYVDNNVKKAFPSYFEYLASNTFEPRSRPNTPYYSEMSKLLAASVHKALTMELSVEDAVNRIYSEIHLMKQRIAE